MMSHTSEAGLEHSFNMDSGVTEKDIAQETKSQCSTSTTSSSSSRAAVRACAKVEAARAHALFVQHEAKFKIEEAQLAAELKIKEARITAELSALEHEKEVVVALAETEVLDAAVEIERRKESSSHHDTVYATIQRTREYVEQHSKLHLNDTEPPELTPYTLSLLPSIKPDVQTDTKQYVSGLVNTASRILPKSDDPASQKPERPMPAVCHQRPTCPSFQPYAEDRTGMSDITRYLLHRELVNPGLIQV